jgi:hypothetical protein
MHFSLLSLFALALAATGTTAKTSSPPTEAVKTCSPPKSDYLWIVLAYKNRSSSPPLPFPPPGLADPD